MREPDDPKYMTTPELEDELYKLSRLRKTPIRFYDLKEEAERRDKIRQDEIRKR